MLKSHLQKEVVHSYGEGEAGLARFIDSLKLFYKKEGDRYTLLSISTITTYLRNMKSKVLAEIVTERAEKRKRQKDKKNSK